MICNNVPPVAATIEGQDLGVTFVWIRVIPDLWINHFEVYRVSQFRRKMADRNLLVVVADITVPAISVLV